MKKAKTKGPQRRVSLWMDGFLLDHGEAKVLTVRRQKSQLGISDSIPRELSHGAQQSLQSCSSGVHAEGIQEDIGCSAYW